MRFLRWLVENENLKVGMYLEKMSQEPFFLVAATGLGKTVAVPLHVLMRQCELASKSSGPELRNGPRVWVVEPRIPIARDQMDYMNAQFARFLATERRPPSGQPKLFGCITSATGRVNDHAPIVFVTTGILASMARRGQLRPGRDRIIIDEAHVTVEQNADVELAIAIARNSGVVVDYMSATVDASNLGQTLGVSNIIQADERRYPIWMHNLGAPLEECVANLVLKTLVSPDPHSEYFPGHGYPQQERVLKDVLGGEKRARGMLIVVNSFTGARSDVDKLARLIEDVPYNRIEAKVTVLKLASKIVRDPAALAQFERQMREIERSAGKYVVLATSVVEMGVTFPSLDFVVTMDSGYENVVIGDSVVPHVVPLGVNSMMQRLGRVGRRRCGIGFISQEVGAAYATMGDKALNSGALRNEPIRLPLATGPVTSLAMYSFEQGWDDPLAGLAQLNLPSRIHQSDERQLEFVETREKLVRLGIAEGSRLSGLGAYADKWIGTGDLAYAVELQKEMESNDPSLQRFLFWAVAHAASDLTLRELLTTGGSYQLDEDILDELGSRPAELSFLGDLFALYQIVAAFAKYDQWLDRKSGLMATARAAEEAFEADCGRMLFNPIKVKQLLDAVNATLQLACDINRERPEFQVLFDETRELRTSMVTWPRFEHMSDEMRRLAGTINGLPGRVRLDWDSEENDYGQDVYAWEIHGHSRPLKFDPSQSPTAVREEWTFTGKLIANASARGEEKWHVGHVQVLWGEDDDYYYDFPAREEA